MDRLLVAFPDPAPELLAVEGDAFHHVARVLRARVGLTLELFDGQGRFSIAHLERLDEARAYFRLGPIRSAPPSRPTTLIQGLPKGERWEWILQKGCELGVTRFVPVSSERSVVQLTEGRAQNRHARWVKIIEEASRQCGRTDVPELSPVQSLAASLEWVPPGTPLVLLDEEENARTLRQVLEPLPKESPIAVAIGPEGGWARDEVSLLCQRGAIPASLGSRILRVETAAVAVLGVLAYLTLG